MLENLKKHSGVLSNTGVRVAIVFRKLPNEEDSCLIVETERLPDSYHDYLIQCLNSREAAETNDFYEVLNRRTFPDGTNCLTSLHTRGMLRKEPIINVTMLPLPGQKVPLALINATIDGKVAEYKAKQITSAADAIATVRAAEQAAIDESAPKDPAIIAKGLIMQAELLESEAASKREEAYALAPELRPGRGRPVMADNIKAVKMEERKDKRRIRDQANAAAAKIDKRENAIDAAVAAKIARDSVRVAPVNTSKTKSPKA